MKLSNEGKTLIHGNEGCRLRAYKDTKGVWTIGWGHTGPEVKPGLVWNQVKCDEQFAADIAQREAEVTKALEDSLTTQRQFDALMSLEYNIGIHAFLTSTVLKRHKLGYYGDAADAFMMWIKKTVNGKLVDAPELIPRRQRERRFYLGLTE